MISLRNALPTWAMPNGGFLRANCSTFLKFTKMPWAVSGRRKTCEPSSCTGPMWVSNIRLKLRGSDSSPPHSGHLQLALGLSLAQVVLAPALLALAQALHERVGEALEVARGLPGPRVHEDRGVQGHHVVALLDTARHHSALTLVFSSTP